MKFGLFIALLVLVASTNVFGRRSSLDKPDREKNTDGGVEESDFGTNNGFGSNNEETDRRPSEPDLDRSTPRKNKATVEKLNDEGLSTPSKDSDVTVVKTNKPSTVKVKTSDGKSEVTVESGRGQTPVERENMKNKEERPKETNVGSKPVDEIVERRPEKPDATLINKVASTKDKPLVEVSRMDDRFVHVSGNIVYMKYQSSVIDTVRYELNGGFDNDRRVPLKRPLIARDFIARRSRVMLYVSTSKTTDPKLAFNKFEVKFTEENFPLSFDVKIELPTQQRGLLERADITLYFFVYITNPDTRIDTFIPAGTSQILLQGTNQLFQTLDVYVKANGLEITGLFRERFNSKYIRADTSFQVFIVPEQSLSLRYTAKFDSIAQLTITNVPAMYPVAFSLLINYQVLKPDTKYYAIAFIVENGVRRLINQEPIWIINEQKVLVLSRVVFNVVPSPLILVGSVTRAMPGLYTLQPRSSLIIRIREVGSNAPDIIFKLKDITSFPQSFQINMSSTLRFDALKKYEVRALVLDERNSIYMATLQAIPLPDDISKLILPVDDLLYYVSVRLHSSSNQLLTYVPGSSVQILVSESPEPKTRPIASLTFNKISAEFRDFQIQIPATSIERNKSYFLIMIIEVNGMLTHVSKTLLISNNQPPPSVIQLPVLSLNLITGMIYDYDNRPAQWSSSSFANIYLIDTKIDNPDKAIVQVWKVHLENDFPIRFEVQVDFSRLLLNHTYRLQAAIDSGRNVLEYKPAASVLVLDPSRGILPDVRVAVTNVKTFQMVHGLVYINGIEGPLPEKGEVLIQLSSTPSLMNPSIIDEIRVKVEGRKLPLDFSMKLPLTKIDINAVYYFLVQYSVRDTVIIPVSQAFAFSPRNEATVALTISKTAQIPITGQVTSTGSPLILPTGSVLHIYITDGLNLKKPMIYSEVFLEASPNSLYQFTMNLDSILLQRKIVLYLHAEIIYNKKVILSIGRPPVLAITPGGEWNINLVIDAPTLLIGRIVSMNDLKGFSGDLDVQIQIINPSTKDVVLIKRVRVEGTSPYDYRIQLNNELFVRYRSLQARAIITNCKGQVLFDAGNLVDIRLGLNVGVDLTVVVTDQKKLKELESIVDETAPLTGGKVRMSITGVEHELKPLIATTTNEKKPRRDL